MFFQITVAEAAALLNVGIVFMTLSFPLLLAVVTIGGLKKTNAATWSVLSRLINRSLWPDLLGTDSAGTVKVEKRTRYMTLIATFATVALAIAAVLTPLGLYDTLRLKEAEEVPFTYVRDHSLIGRSTPSRDGYSMNRWCGYYTSCPGNNDHVHFIVNSTGATIEPDDNASYATISTHIAPNITEVFTSATGANASTIASVFDIQYRFFANYNHRNPYVTHSVRLFDHGQPRTQGQFEFVQDFIQDAAIQLIEGIIVSTTDQPGIGFRNHTSPPSTDLGYAWKEQILWLEPETACTNLNITFNFTSLSPDNDLGLNIKGSLVDRGGFATLRKRYEAQEQLLAEAKSATQDNPALSLRSYLAALYTNAVLLGAMNITKSHWDKSYIGKEYDLGKTFELDGTDMDPLEIALSGFGYEESTNGGDTVIQWDPNLPPPLQFVNKGEKLGVVKNIADYVLAYVDNMPNITRPGVAGGLFLGVGVPLDAHGHALSRENHGIDPGSRWSRPLYSCVSAVKASIKTVEFQSNGTAALANTHVKSVAATNYAKSALPIWAMELTGFNNTEAPPFWGVVSAEMVGHPGISTLRRPEFYLPVSAGVDYASGFGGDDAAAGAHSPLAAFLNLYNNNIGAASEDLPASLAGTDNGVILQRWSSLSADASSAGKVLDLLWTDVIANELVCSKSPLSVEGDAAPASSVLVPAQSYGNLVAYDWRYSVVALLSAALWVVFLIWSLALFCTRRLTFAFLTSILNQSAAGRSMTTERYEAKSKVDFAARKEWAKVRGDEMVRLAQGAEVSGTPPTPSHYSLLPTKPECEVMHSAVSEG